MSKSVFECNDYADLEKLEFKYQSELRAQKYGKEQNINNAETQVKRQDNSLQLAGASTIQNLRTQANLQEQQLNKLRQNQQDTIKNQQQQQQQSSDDLFLEDIVQLKKDKELRCKIEKDQIRRALAQIERTTKTQPKSYEAQQLLETLLNDREDLRKRETELIEDFEQLQQQKVDQLEQMQFFRQNDKTKIKLILNDSDKLYELKNKRMDLEKERQRILQNLEYIKNGQILLFQAKPISNNNNFKKWNPPGQYDDLFGAETKNLHKGNQITRNGIVQIQSATNRDRQQVNPQQREEDFQRQLREQQLIQKIDQLEKSQVEVMKPIIENIQNSAIQQEEIKQQLQQQQKLLMLQQEYQQQLLQNRQNQQPIQNQIQNFSISPPSYPQQQQFEQPQRPVVPNEFGVQFNQNQGNLNEIDIAKNNEYNHFSLQNIGMEEDANPFSIFTGQKEFLVQNEPRTVDLEEEERILQQLIKEEIDLLRVVSRIPIGTELYRYKMEQYKDLSATKAEVVKILNEQRLQQLRREFEMERRDEDRKYDNEKWIDDQRKWIIQARIRKDVGINVGKIKRYDQIDGFLLHWDYILGLPRRCQFGQIVFAVYNHGETIYSPKLVEPKETEVESTSSVRCIMGESHQIFDIVPHPDNLLIIEIQLPYSKKSDENVGRTESYGWTQLDLFDFKKELKRGRYKCPIYYGPTDPGVNIEEIKSLDPIPGAWVYLRLSYPNDEDFGKARSIYPDHTMHEYLIPPIHISNAHNALKKRDDANNKVLNQKAPTDQSNLKTQQSAQQQQQQTQPSQQQQGPNTSKLSNKSLSQISGNSN